MEGLNTFLAETKAKFLQLQPETAPTLSVVLGNESADLDTITSAISLAYFLHTTEESKSAIIVPVLPFPEEDWRLKTETAYVFAKLGVSTSNLVFSEASTQKMTAYAAAGRLSLTLVDHNVLGEEWRQFAPNVKRIVDHHEDQMKSSKIYPDQVFATLEAEITVIGSATTLIAERFISKAPALLSAKLASLLLAPILIDTSNFDAKMKKGTPRDRAAFETLTKVEGLEPWVRDTTAFYEAITKAKTDLSSLTTTDLLRKDYKEWTTAKSKYGIASTLLSLHDWTKRDPTLLDELSTFLRNRKLLVLVVMAAFVDPASKEFRRELFILSADSSVLTLLATDLEGPLSLTKYTAADIGLQPAKMFPSDSWAAWGQQTIANSRKQVQPLVQRLLQSKY